MAGGGGHLWHDPGVPTHSLRQLRFQSPYPGRKHQVMQRGPVTLRIGNPHEGDISLRLLSALLKEAGIGKDEWEALQAAMVS